MSLKSFLAQQGFIKDDAEQTKKDDGESKSSTPVPPAAAQPVTPTYFPIYASGDSQPPPSSAGDPSFVAPLQQQAATMPQGGQPDPAFVKFFEDEMVKANLPGPDYFEFRQLLVKTQQKMANKGMTAPEVILQAVLMSFEAQEITPAKLMEAARHYKDVMQQKKDDFLKGAEAEKNNQLQKRQSVLQGHTDAINKLQQQIQQLELQRKQLEDSMNKEKTQLDVDKSLGKEAIDKIERAQRSISVAHDYMQYTVDTDIKRLQSV